MKKKIQEILSALTLEEKAGLCSGADFWHLKSVERLNLSSIMMCDGPHGLRKQSGDVDHLGISKSEPATCFPTAATTACSWDIDLLTEMGKALGEECLEKEISVILGPGANIKRSPLCGRNFEYFSEDPLLSGHMATAWINGVQSQGVGVSLKHFVLNNQEERRMTIDAVVDERAMREIYLRSFELAVKAAKPWTVMCSYNRVYGTYLSDNKKLLSDVLRDEWGFSGLVMSDWGATNDRVAGIEAGMDLEMPSNQELNDAKIVAAVKNGTLSEADLDKVVTRVITLILNSLHNKKKGYSFDSTAHHAMAQRIAAESTVLLKNDGLLPLKENQSLAVIGEFAKSPRYQGAGSSIINPSALDNTCAVLDKNSISYTYAQGYNKSSNTPDDALLSEAVKAAKAADVVLLFAGLPDAFESEGFDRKHISLPDSHNELIRQILSVNQNTVIILQNGAPVAMPWANDAKAILECYLGGQAGAGAAVDILFGKVNPSGKLAETFPLALEDNPAYKHFPGHIKTVEYRESIFVGYRYYDTAEKPVLFPFGHGLSYTTFEYSNLSISPAKNSYDVSLDVKNAGQMDGAEIIQLYIKNAPSTLFKAKKELKAFKKIKLQAGETKKVDFKISKDAFAYYNTDVSDWHVQGGDYMILIGASSRDIRLSQTVSVKETKTADVPDTRETLPAYHQLKDEVLNIPKNQFETLLGRPVPCGDAVPGPPFTDTHMLRETQNHWFGRLVIWFAKKEVANMMDMDDAEAGNIAMHEAQATEMPIRALVQLGGDSLPKYFVNGFIEILNGHFFKGIRWMLKK
ncbi:MAG: glycoside hydrolase family 3 C-terminal domain-containing protein [Eubacteriales bacterium]